MTVQLAGRHQMMNG